MSIAELVDFGSTFTKVRLVDLDGGTLAAASQAPTTASTHLLDGWRAARTRLGDRFQDVPRSVIRASSSAAGGLRMIAVGLVPELTLKAARTAALGAGARVVGSYGYRLDLGEVAEIEARRPDIVLLAGGTEGGDREVVVHNAARLAASSITCPVIMAGNKDAADGVVAALSEAGKEVWRADNVLPELDRLNVASCSALIREIFAREIVRARGIADAEELVGSAVIPTPLAVLRAAEILSAGSAGHAGMGELMVVDVGGATTDVHSVADGAPERERVVVHGIPEPHAKRTVEGDLGIRVNAVNVARLLAGALPPGSWDPVVIARAGEIAERLAGQWSALPQDAVDAAADELLAATAVFTAVGRHVGRIETLYGPRGEIHIQNGKDLSKLTTVIGTGGVFTAGADLAAVLAAARAADTDPTALRPVAPKPHADRSYSIFAVGLLADVDPDAAVALGRSTIVEV